MINKALRILIADKSYPQSLSIEKVLNRLGYYCIASACSLEEVERLSGYGTTVLDLLVINADLLLKASASRLACLELAYVDNVVVYGFKSSVVDLVEKVAPNLSHPLCVMVSAPEYVALEARMALIDRQE